MTGVSPMVQQYSDVEHATGSCDPSRSTGVGTRRCGPVRMGLLVGSSLATLALALGPVAAQTVPARSPSTFGLTAADFSNWSAYQVIGGSPRSMPRRLTRMAIRGSASRWQLSIAASTPITRNLLGGYRLPLGTFGSPIPLERSAALFSSTSTVMGRTFQERSGHLQPAAR